MAPAREYANVLPMNDNPLTLEDLGLVALPPQRRRAPPPPLEYVRDLEASDLDTLLTPGPKNVTVPPIKQLRQTHHQLARLMASGLPQVEISRITGYTQTRVSTLKNDPAFAELIAYYKTQVEAKFLDIHEKLATVGTLAVEELSERAEDGKLANRELLELAEFCLDRSLTPQGRTAPQASGGVNIAINFVKPEEPAAVAGPVIDIEPDK